MSFRDRPRRPQLPPLPKPYDFVPLPDARPKLAPPAGHQRYHAGRLSGSFSAKIIVRSPLHVASGTLEPQPRNRDYPVAKAMFRVGGEVAIPATSLKGCIRSLAEAISHSTIQVTRAREIERDYQPSRRPERDGVDVVQNMFGTLGYQGLVRFSDARLREGRTIIVPTPQLFRPRSESVETYFDGRRPHGRKFYMHGKLAKGNLPLEACDVASEFALSLTFENLTPGELGLLLTALGLGEPKWWPKLGGAKPACLGTIEISEPHLVAYTPQAAYRDFDAPTTPVALAPLLEAAHNEKLIVGAAAQQLAEILRWPREERECPERNY
ncbi:RAMP superfamily CRISPR-associated protein [Candidatus Viridilinea mediisalina]|uniref:CRISPR type III-associated protein domain-containing protein n=1 Tax=Candidatus Viridilinea mediisalina TaxID=2024553 RepID=A0A2A6RMH8_9CHLR|nr:RAMP superfamily CRISPR-associated protein [Candidatus Viridilinea mediisalina]PDW04088.1 hypothetical protein CJ255_05195 [Candidatus Viridilinea mediisalina]